jgi:hypothetical protein
MSRGIPITSVFGSVEREKMCVVGGGGGLRV